MDGPVYRPEPGDAAGVTGWFRRAPAERLTLPAAGLVWGAAAVLHWVHVSAAWPALAAAAGAWWAYRRASRGARRIASRHDREWERNHGADAAAVAATAGAWACAATAWGPLTGEYVPLSVAWAVAALGGYWWVRRHERVTWARDWRARRAGFRDEALALGLHGAHLITHAETRLGERYEVDTTGTGQLSSALARSSLAERIAQKRQLPRTQVRVSEGRIAGRLLVAIREGGEGNPWGAPVTHPVLDPDGGIPPPVPRSVRDRAVIGIDPETGAPSLTVPLYDEAGGKRIGVVGTTRWAGKSVLLSCIREQVTAMPDALIIGINLSKAIEDAAWAEACHLTAIGPEQASRAQQIMDLVCDIIAIRPSLRDTAVFQPAPDDPAIILMIDEVDAAVPWIKRQIQTVASKGGSEGVTLIEAGQRGVAQWFGGPGVRAVLDVFCCGALSRTGEQSHAAGPFAARFPDMTTFGGGARGVWAIGELGSDVIQTGRTFPLVEPADLRGIARDRARWQPVLPAALTERLGDRYAALLGSDAYAAAAAAPGPSVTISDDSATDGDDVAPPPPGDDLERWPVHADGFPATPQGRRDMLGHARDLQAESDAIQARIASADPAAIAAAKAARLQQAIDSTPLPDLERSALISLLCAPGGTTIRAAAKALGVPRNRAHIWLLILSREGIGRLDRKGRSSSWTLTGGDGQ